MRRLDDRSRMSGDVHVRFYESLRGRFPWATRRVVIAPTRWKLREAIRNVNRTLNMQSVEKHPDKTFIGKVEIGFDFLGYFMKPGSVMVAVNTLTKFVLHVSRLYEQGADKGRIGKYVIHWCRWAMAGWMATFCTGINRCAQDPLLRTPVVKYYLPLLFFRGFIIFSRLVFCVVPLAFTDPPGGSGLTTSPSFPKFHMGGG